MTTDWKQRFEYIKYTPGMESERESVDTDEKEQKDEELNPTNMIASVWVKVEMDSDDSKPFDEENEDKIQQDLQLNQSDRPKKSKTKEKILQCDMCDYSTSYKNCLKVHILGHSETKPFACELCDYASKFPTGLQRHKLIKHQIDSTKDFNIHKCDQCDYSTYFKSNLKSHKRKHLREKQFKCNHCTYETAYKHNFIKHSKLHVDVSFKCDQCTFETKYEGHIYRHMTKIHDGVMDKGFKCDFCDFSTIVRWRLNIHKQRSKQNKLLKCSDCEFETMYKCESKKHRRDHRGEVPGHRVERDDDVERICYRLSQNMQHAVPPVEPECSKDLQDFNYTDDHQKTNHYIIDPNCLVDWNNIPVLDSPDVDLPFRCPKCEYAAKFKASVQRHYQRNHTDKHHRPYKCCFCGFSTKTKDQITLHSKRSRSNRNLCCTACNYTTWFKCQLVMHQKIHNGFKCNVCSYSSKNKYDLQKHVSTQHLGYCYKCQYCDHKAARKDSLLCHEATHTGNKPVKCAHCDYKTVRKCFLMTHVNKHHSDNDNAEDADDGSKVASPDTN